mgnify:CR=1 FL=1
MTMTEILLAFVIGGSGFVGKEVVLSLGFGVSNVAVGVLSTWG